MVRFAVMSDIHIRHVDAESRRRFVQAWNDYSRLPERPDFVIINGDLTEGFEEDYEELLRLLKVHASIPYYVTMGNHEYYRMWYDGKGDWSPPTFPNGYSSEEAVNLFLRSFSYDKPYYSLQLNGYRFIFLMGEKYRDQKGGIADQAWLSDKQLEFAAACLEPHTDSSVPVFVFLHQPLNEVVQGERLKALLSGYPQVILFNGHTHHQLTSSRIYSEEIFAVMGTSSVRWPWDENDRGIDGPINESVWVEALPGKVAIKGRRHDEQAWVEQAVFERRY